MGLKATGCGERPMGSRRILIGLVAVVGLSLPIWPDGGCGFTAIRDWAIVQLADWDTYTPRRGNPYIVAKPPLSSSEETTPVRTGTAVTASYETIPIDEDLVSGVAHELNRMAEGLDIAPTFAAHAGSRPDFAAASSCDSIELKLAVDFCRSFESPRAHARDTAHASPQPANNEAVVVVDDMFAETAEAYEPSAEGLETNVEAGSITAAPPSSFEPVECLADFTESLSEEPDRLGEGEEIHPQDVVTRSARKEKSGTHRGPGGSRIRDSLRIESRV